MPPSSGWKTKPCMISKRVRQRAMFGLFSAQKWRQYILRHVGFLLTDFRALYPRSWISSYFSLLCAECQIFLLIVPQSWHKDKEFCILFVRLSRHKHSVDALPQHQVVSSTCSAGNMTLLHACPY